MGSSPRVRGRPDVLGDSHGATGLIPASAGRTRRGAAKTAASRAHPRECGADRNQALSLPGGEGSSPRVRGGLNQRVHLLAGQGLIPASAGRTRITQSLWVIWRAHPRECGADFSAGVTSRSPRGSYPRVRGGQPSPGRWFLLVGLIPASAGQTICRTVVWQ